MRARGDLLLTPTFVVAVAVLALNDRVLKARWPGLVTGKLSDVAGVVMVAIVLAAVTRSVRWAIGATVLAFGLLKTMPVVADLAVPVLGGRTVTDRTDLVALVALWPLARWLHGRMALPIDAEGRAWRDRAALMLIPAKVVAIGAAALVTSASGCSSGGVNGFSRVDSTVVAVTDGFVVESADGGVTWIESAAERLDGADRTELRCAADGTCWSTAERRVIAAAPDATERVEVELSPEQMQELEVLAPDDCGFSSFTDVVVSEQADGTHVVVAMARAGVLHRAPDGRWEWVSVGSAGLPQSAGDEFAGIPIRRDGGVGLLGGPLDQVISALVIAMPIAVVAAAWPAATAARRRGRRGIGLIVASLVGGVVFTNAGLALAASRGIDGTWRGELGLVTVAVLGAVAWIVATISIARRDRPGSAAPPPWPSVNR